MTLELKRYTAEMYEAGWYVVNYPHKFSCLHSSGDEPVESQVVFGPYGYHESFDLKQILNGPPPPRFEGEYYDPAKKYVSRTLERDGYIICQVPRGMDNTRIPDAWGPFNDNDEALVAWIWLEARRDDPDSLSVPEPDPLTARFCWDLRPFDQMSRETLESELMLARRQVKVLETMRRRQLDLPDPDSVAVQLNEIQRLEKQLDVMEGKLAQATSELVELKTRPSLAWQLEPTEPGMYAVIDVDTRPDVDFLDPLGRWQFEGGPKGRKVALACGPLPGIPEVLPKPDCGVLLCRRKSDGEVYYWAAMVNGAAIVDINGMAMPYDSYEFAKLFDYKPVSQ